MDDSFLQNKIASLEAENALLKSLLAQAGISYELPAFSGESIAIAPQESNQGERILPLEIMFQHARRFFSYFWGRMDVFARRYQSKTTGKAGYFPQCDHFWKKGICPKALGRKIKCKDCPHRAWTPLNPAHIEAHLRGAKADGSDVIGVYPLFPDGTCRFMVFDFDHHDATESDGANVDTAWREEVAALREICRQHKIPALTERSRSGHGAHVWIFFDAPISAALVHRFGFALLEKGAETVNLKSFRYYDRMLPAQSTLSADELGNLIALPLQGQAIKSGNSAFVDAQQNAFPDQWNALFSVERLSQQQIQSYLTQWNKSDQGLFSALPEDTTKPWERGSMFHASDVVGQLQVVLANQLYISTENLKPRLQNQIRRMAAFPNPAFYKNRAMGLSAYAQPRFLYLGEDVDGYLCIPRGLLDSLKEKCSESGIEIHIEDKRNAGCPIAVAFTGTLHENQKAAINTLLPHDCGILSAATAFGKTVTCCGIIAEKRVSTLILLESSTLVTQWEKALNTFLAIAEEAPSYRTKSGRLKTRKSPIGIIQGAKDTSTGIIDIAMAGSLMKKGTSHRRLQDYGLVLVDECHHSASETITAVLQEISAKYVYGVTATPFRSDGREKINHMLLGPVRYQYTAMEKALHQGVQHWVVPRFTRMIYPHGQCFLHINEAYELLRNS